MQSNLHIFLRFIVRCRNRLTYIGIARRLQLEMKRFANELFEETPVGVSSTIARVLGSEFLAGSVELGGLIIGLLPITAGCGAAN